MPPRIAIVRRSIERLRIELESYGPNGYREVVIGQLIREYTSLYRLRAVK